MKCSQCDNQARPGYKMCTSCQTRSRENERRRRAAHAAMGRCSDCGKNPPNKPSTRCLDCLDIRRIRQAEYYAKNRDKMREYMRQWRRSNKARGKCECGADRAKGRAKCAKCLRDTVRTVSRVQERRKFAGLCMRCGREPQLPGMTLGACCAAPEREYTKAPRVPAADHPWRQTWSRSLGVTG